MDWTPEQVLALAPDAGSAKAARDLAHERKWVSAGKSTDALWGECQGSGAVPYQTAIDGTEPAFKCSCPSRKFPCKHGLGLMLLAATPAAVAAADPPLWVSSWIEGRAAKSQQKAKRDENPAEQCENKPVVSTQAVGASKSVAARESKVAAGIEELDLWLRDMVRSGIADLASKPKGYWSDRSSRLIDAQAPGLARMVTELGRVSSAGANWQARALEQIGLLYLLMEGYRRQESLPTDLRADVRSLTGWNQSQEDVLASLPIHDRWLVVGQRVVQEEHLTVQRTWLWAEARRQPALILSFTAGRQAMPIVMPVGGEFEGDLCFFESAAPLRALIREKQTVPPRKEKERPIFWTLPEAMQWRAEQLARLPWLDVTPFVLSNIFISRDETGQWIAHHEDDSSSSVCLPISPLIEPLTVWRLAACAGGAPSSICCEWDGSSLMPLSIWEGGAMTNL